MFRITFSDFDCPVQDDILAQDAVFSCKHILKDQTTEYSIKQGKGIVLSVVRR